MTVNWSDNAIDRLRGHIKRIAEDGGIETARRWHNRLIECVAMLETFPTLCPISPIPDLASLGIHELCFGNYRVFYVIREDDCRVISILNCRQNVSSVGDL